MRTDRLVEEHNVKLRHTMFPLPPETPEEGWSLEDLFGGQRECVDSMCQRLVSLMEAEGFPYGDRTHTYNSRLAQELAKWADTQPDGADIHKALYRACTPCSIDLLTIIGNNYDRLEHRSSDTTIYWQH